MSYSLIYLAERNIDSEEGDILGIFSTKEKAQVICDKVQQSSRYGDSCSCIAYKIDEINHDFLNLEEN